MISLLSRWLMAESLFSTKAGVAMPSPTATVRSCVSSSVHVSGVLESRCFPIAIRLMFMRPLLVIMFFDVAECPMLLSHFVDARWTSSYNPWRIVRGAFRQSESRRSR